MCDKIECLPVSTLQNFSKLPFCHLCINCFIMAQTEKKNYNQCRVMISFKYKMHNWEYNIVPKNITQAKRDTLKIHPRMASQHSFDPFLWDLISSSFCVFKSFIGCSCKFEWGMHAYGLNVSCSFTISQYEILLRLCIVVAFNFMYILKISSKPR